MVGVKIDSGQFRSVRDLDDRRDVMMVVNWWQKTAYNYPEKTEWIIKMYDEAKEFKLHEQFGYKSLEEFMSKEVLFKYDIVEKDIQELLTRIRNGELTALNKQGAPFGNNNASSNKNKVDNINFESKGGDDPAYKIRRLKRDAPELADKVINGELSANAAFIEAGLGKRKITIEPTVEGFAKAINKTLSEEQKEELKQIF